MEQKTTTDVLRERASEELINWARSKRTLITDQLRNAFEAYYASVGVANRGSEKDVYEWRKIASGRIVIDSIHALDKLQLLKAESATKEIAADFNRCQSLKR